MGEFTTQESAVIPHNGCNLSCTAYMDSAINDPAPAFEPFNEFIIKKPSCCVLTVTTSAGEITIPKGVEAFTSIKFDCLVEDLTLSGCDDLTDVTVIVMNSGI